MHSVVGIATIIALKATERTKAALGLGDIKVDSQPAYLGACFLEFETNRRLERRIV